MVKRWWVLAATLCGLAGYASAQQRPFDPARHHDFAGSASQVLVLGTPHLSGFKTLDPKSFDPLLDRLAAWQPQIITIEQVSGPQCDDLRRYKTLHPDAADTYCWDETPARDATGLDLPQAVSEAERLFASLPPQPSAAQRRHLAAILLAANDQASALVQWLRLPVAERHAGDGLTPTLVTQLGRQETQKSEDYVIAAALAARLGLERIYQTDDHTAEGRTGEDPAFGPAIEKLWDNPAARERLKCDKAATALATDGAGVLAMYRYYNDPDIGEAAFRSDFGAALQGPDHGRRYVADWETRNLRMVANIRDVLGKRPGARLLTVVGASHKAYFEAYLRLMHDVTLADALAVLGPAPTR